MEPLALYMPARRYTWRCKCGWNEKVRLYLRPTVFIRKCPDCHDEACLTDEVIEAQILFTTG